MTCIIAKSFGAWNCSRHWHVYKAWLTWACLLIVLYVPMYGHTYAYIHSMCLECISALYTHIYICTCFILTTTQRCGRDTAQKKKQRRMCSMSVRPTWPALALTFSPPGWKVKSHTRKPETHEQTHLLPSNGGSLSRLKRERMARAARNRETGPVSVLPSPHRLS